MNRRWLAASGLCLLPGAALAAVNPEPSIVDPRRQAVAYDPDEVVELRVTPGYVLTLEFAPDERVENIAVGDSGAWQVMANNRADRVFVKAVQAGIASNMTVITDLRSYVFNLVPAVPGLFSPFTVRFRYPAPALAEAGAEAESDDAGHYRISGYRAIRPDRIEEDDGHMRIHWKLSQDIPAIFVVEADGSERPVAGAMRGDEFITDEIAVHLRFRSDNAEAEAVRIVGRIAR